MKKIFAAALCLSLMLVFCSCLSTEEPRSVRTVEINEKGELIVIFSDGTESNVGVVKGDKGDTGENGKDGRDGVDGKDGKDGKDGEKGEQGLMGIEGKDGRAISSVSADPSGALLVTYSDGKTETVELLGSLYLFGGYLNSEKTATWSLYNGGFLYISGEGATYDYGVGNAPWIYITPLISAVFVDTSAGLVLDAELLTNIDPDTVFYIEKTTPMWVDMTVKAPIYATAEEVNSPDTATPIAELPLGTELAVADINDDYAKILYNGGHAYIAKKYVRNNNGSVVFNAPEGFSKLEVTGKSGAVLRYFPDTSSDNKYNTEPIPKGVLLNCTGVSVNKTWYRVSFEGETLYVYMSVVTPVAEE